MAQKKRSKIKNLNIGDLKSLFNNEDLIDLDKVNQDNFSKIGKLIKSDVVKDIGKGMLFLSVMVGVLTVAAVAPNLFLIFKHKGKRYYKKISKDDYKYCMNNLRNRKWITHDLNSQGNLYQIRLTKKGLEKANELKFNDIRVEKPLRWDHKWRIVVFDIPEKHKSARDALRRKLQELGFYKLQDSIFIYPYECFKEIDIICKVFCVTPFVQYLVAEEFYNDYKAKKYFGF